MMFESKYLYSTEKGKAIIGNSLELMKELPDNSINLVITSPPFALSRPKEYGNKDQEEYIDWILEFTNEVKRIITLDGSFVIDLGGAYQKGIPIRSLYNYRLLIRMCDEQGWKLAEEFFWYNPAKLPSPIEWVNKRKIRAKDSVNTVWWLSKSDYPKSDVKKVLSEYSDRMKKLIENSSKYFTHQKNVLQATTLVTVLGMTMEVLYPLIYFRFPTQKVILNTLNTVKILEIKGHPARFPSKLPEFFIKFLTDENDLVLDIFAGSNTAGWIAQQLNRKWLAFELDHQYLAASIFRFVNYKSNAIVKSQYENLLSNPVAKLEIEEVNKQQELFE